jgi:hypothetical protein
VPRYMLFAAAALCGGCVPVTEPVGDIDKAEPDKALVGKWTEGFGNQATVTIEVPDVKGNPKGLMWVGETGGNEYWFFTTRVGKHTYANLILGEKFETPPPLRTEGEFAKWKKDGKKRYFVVRYTLDGDRLTVDGGNHGAFQKLMAGEKVAPVKDEDFYPTPAGWLAKYLDKNGPDALFDGSNKGEYRRAKK